jgi:hypothetical protein
VAIYFKLHVLGRKDKGAGLGFCTQAGFIRPSCVVFKGIRKRTEAVSPALAIPHLPRAAAAAAVRPSPSSVLAWWLLAVESLRGRLSPSAVRAAPFMLWPTAS